MLSEETAVGHDPVGVVQMMSRLLIETEPLLPAHQGPDRALEANALAHAAAELADDLGAAAVIVPTRTGVSARQLAAFRPRRPILAYSRVPETTRRLHLVWGVAPSTRRAGRDGSAARGAGDGAPRLLGKGSRVICFDIAAPGLDGVPSVINSITL